MATKYQKIRDEMEKLPGVHPRMREWITVVNASISWPTTTTTTSTTTTTTTSTTTTT